MLNDSEEICNNVIENNMVVPGMGDYEIIDYVKDFTYYKELNYSSSFMPSPLMVEKHKALNSIKNNYGIEAFAKANFILANADYRRTKDKDEYSVNGTIKEHNISVTLPEKLSTISNTYMSREIVSLLKDGNEKELSLKYTYSKAIPMFHELVEAYNSSIKKCDFIINHRLAILQSNAVMQKKALEESSDPSLLRIGFMESNAEFLSYYYAVRLFNIYLRQPISVLSSVKEVVLGQKTTGLLLNYYGLTDEINLDDFLRTSDKLERKALR